jgi:hypothetical protein
MRVTRIFSDEAGDSHFGEVTYAVKEAGEIGRISEAIPVKGLYFRENEPGYDYDWHTAPRRQFIVLLDGAIEIETSLRFRGGDVLLLEDTTGKGNRTRNIEQQRRRSIFIAL